MILRKTILTSAALLALAACGRHNDADQANAAAANDIAAVATNGTDTAATNSATTAPASGAQSFVNTAAASDAFEIATSKLALTNGASAAVKSYAQKMIDAHTASTAKLKTTTAGLTPPLTPDPTLNAEQQQKVDSLKALNGAAFDQAYKTEQAAAHQQTLDVLSGYASTGDVPALKTFASGLVPIVTAHLNMVKGLKI